MCKYDVTYQTHTHTNKHTHTHIYDITYYTHTHIYTYIHTNTHTHILQDDRSNLGLRGLLPAGVVPFSVQLDNLMAQLRE